MFETVSPATTLRPNRPVIYEALTVSLALHGLIAGGAVVANLSQVTFPDASPVYTVAFVLSESPAPPPPPPAPPKPAPIEEAVTTAQMQIPREILAPTMIPDEIPIVQPEIAPVAFAVPNGVTGGIATGLLGGIKEGEEGGTIGGKIGGVVADLDGRVHIDRDKKLPMLPLSQVYPNYPEDARVRSWEDELVVRYVIGKDGRVKEVIVIRPPQRDIFVDGTVRAIRSWRFKPMIKDGERQEVVHELTVYYRLSEPTT
ncbi:MAG TPA: energy transducer TonB [Thermoanaerobaculia bacterium]|nr:energy transducer TonB [Thermoanaerobaculia bacterium]